jgi:hypothetical protein
MLETDQGQSDSAVPLVMCRSRGGPYDDEAFVSGWRLGYIGATLGSPGVSALAESIRPEERLQADLLAMARGFTMTVESGSHDEWLYVTFSRTQELR